MSVTVALDARVCLTDIAGIGRYALELSLALLEAGIEARLWFASRKPGPRRDWCVDRLQSLRPEVDVCTSAVSNLLLYSPAAQAAWRHWPRWLPPPDWLPAELDLFHGVYWPLPLSARIPTVLTVHDLIALRHPEWFTPRHSHDLHTIRVLAPRVDHVLTDSEATRQDLLELTGCDPARVTTVLLGVDSEVFAPAPADRQAEVRARYGLDRPYLCTLSTLEPRKNLTRLVAAYDIVCEAARLDLDLVLIGAQGWGANELDALVDQPRRGRIRSLGYVPAEDLPTLLSAAAAMAYVSLYEGFGLPPLEAMACGCPVVCSGTTSLPEVVGDAALRVDPLDVESIADGLRRLLEEPTLAADLGVRGRARAEQLTWRATAEQTAAVYARAIAERPRRRRSA